MICQRPANKARGMLWKFVGGKVEPGGTKEQPLFPSAVCSWRSITFIITGVNPLPVNEKESLIVLRHLQQQT